MKNFDATSSYRTKALLIRLLFLCLLCFSWSEASIAQTCGLPSNWPAGLPGTCQCDNFNRSTLNPSTIFNSNWIAATSDTTGIPPSIAVPGYLRLTDKTTYNAKSATVPGAFPALGNYLSVEFRHYAYNGSGADGMAVILSDYAVPAQTGASGGSLGYAQKTGVSGFSGGWIGIGLDEFGNFQNSNEGRVGGPGPVSQSVGVRGSGTGTTGYAWLYGTGSLSGVNTIDNRTSTTPSRGYAYQVIVDARDYTLAAQKTLFAINRDTSGTGTNYTSFVPQFDVYATAASLGRTQAPPPTNFQLSFTGSTGGSTNIHEIGSLKICAQYFDPPAGSGVLGGFNAIDSTYVKGNVNALQGHLFTKVAGAAFALQIAALNNTNSGISTNYVLSGNKTVTVNLIDDSSGGSCNASTSACTSCSKPVIATQTVNFLPADQGYKQASNFTVNGAYTRVIAKMTDGTNTGCSSDAFSIRPASISSVSSTATNAGLTGNPVFKAGTDPFSITATSNVTGYNGVLKIDQTALRALPTGSVAGSLSASAFPAAVSGSGSSTSTVSLTYSEAGQFKLLGSGVMHGIYDDTWTAVDQGANADCVTGSYSNTADANGKVGCLFGIAADTPLFGRFTASSFAVLNQTVTPACAAPGKIPFTYMGQSFANVSLTIQALNGAGQKLANYDSSLLSSLASISWSAENANDGSNLSSRLAVPPPAKIWLNGQYVVNSTGATFARATGPDGSFASLQLGVSVTDPDGANLSGLDMNPNTAGTCSGNNCTAKAVGTPLAVRYGRLAVQSAFGWEKFRIPVNVQAQYWNGVDFVQNPDDSCTVFSPVNFSLSSFQGLLPCETSITLNNGGQLSAGNGQIVFQAPGKTGSLLISPELGVVATGITCIGLLPVSSSPATAAAKTWLQGRWSGNANYSNNPKATVRFGISRGADKVIDTREVY